MPGVKPPADPKVWIGTYEFAEALGGAFLVYRIRVYPQGEALMADIDVDGTQTMWRLRCRTKFTSKEIKFYFDSYREGLLNKPLKKGDLLLTLRRSRGKLLTYWGALGPNLYESLKNGKVYFEKKPHGEKLEN